MEKYKKVLRLVEERNWKEMEEWLHVDFMYIKETVLMDREEHGKKMEKEFATKQAIFACCMQALFAAEQAIGLAV